MDKTILRKRVDISTWSFVLTTLCLGVVVCACLMQFNRTNVEAWVWLLLGFVCVWAFLSLFYCPMYVRLTDESLNVETSLRIKQFPLEQIVDVKICPSKIAEKRILGPCSFGYWGWYRDPSIGKYFAYYGEPSQTFLVRLKSGKQYMLGCRDSREIAEALANQLFKLSKSKTV